MRQEDLNLLGTEGTNPDTKDIDLLETEEIVRVINSQDKLVAQAISDQSAYIAATIDAIVKRLQSGGRLIYLGAGTSGRLGVLDAAECPCTYGVPVGRVIGVVPGGSAADYTSMDEDEDDAEQAVTDLKEIKLCAKDILVGISASGRTPYVVGGIEYAKSLGAGTASISGNPDSKIARLADCPIVAVVGPEVVSGSTRMKAGTSQKMILNMLSTATMVRLGKVYKNLMVDVQPTNEKLVHRAVRIIMEATGVDEATASESLKAAHMHPKSAIIMILKKCSPDEAASELSRHQGHVRSALAENL